MSDNPSKTPKKGNCLKDTIKRPLTRDRGVAMFSLKHSAVSIHKSEDVHENNGHAMLSTDVYGERVLYKLSDAQAKFIISLLQDAIKK